MFLRSTIGWLALAAVCALAVAPDVSAQATYQMTIDASGLFTQGGEYVLDGPGEPDVTLPVAAQTLSLESGAYSIYVGSGELMSCNLTVTANGDWDYDQSCTYLTGRNSTTLRIMGYPVTIDPSALSSQVDFDAGTDSFGTAENFNLVPLAGGADYYFLPGSGIFSTCDFNVDDSGHVTYDASVQGCLTGSGTSTLGVDGEPVEIDATALSTQVLSLPFIVGDSAEHPSDAPVSYRLLPLEPGDTYLVSTDTGVDGNLGINVDTTDAATVSANATGWTSVSGNTVTITGRPVTIDATAIAPDSFTIASGDPSPGLDAGSVQHLQLAPADGDGTAGLFGYTFASSLSRFYFGVSDDGEVEYPAGLGQCVTGSGTSTLTVACNTAAQAPAAAITAPSDGATYTQGTVIEADFSCTAGSNGGVLASAGAGCSGPVMDATPIDTTTPGPHTFTVTATDTDGQTATQTVHYQVQALPGPTPTGTLTLSQSTVYSTDPVSCQGVSWDTTDVTTNWAINGTFGEQLVATGATFTPPRSDDGRYLVCRETAVKNGITITVSSSTARITELPATSDEGADFLPGIEWGYADGAGGWSITGGVSCLSGWWSSSFDPGIDAADAELAQAHSVEVTLTRATSTGTVVIASHTFSFPLPYAAESAAFQTLEFGTQGFTAGDTWVSDGGVTVGQTDSYVPGQGSIFALADGLVGLDYALRASDLGTKLQCAFAVENGPAATPTVTTKTVTAEISNDSGCGPRVYAQPGYGDPIDGVWTPASCVTQQNSTPALGTTNAAALAGTALGTPGAPAAVTGTQAALPLDCTLPGGCAGTLRLTSITARTSAARHGGAHSARAKRASGAVVLASAHISLRHGARVVLRIRMTAAGKRLLAHHRGAVSATVTLQTRGQVVTLGQVRLFVVRRARERPSSHR